MIGHPFLNHYHRCSRQHFILTTAGAATAAFLAGCGGRSLMPGGGTPGFADSASRASSLAPVPIPPNPALGGLNFQIPNVPGLGDEVSTIYDFNGEVGRAIPAGVGTGNGAALFWSGDLAFMDGEYRSAAGTPAHGTFAFF
ncbi:MAG TPA: hypothetical protein VJP85_05205 [Candidatus Baltobacteraceae bacterium]|nr:hypothetical protein [Candidatus Baltobacteraceae bacterium]